MRFKIVFFFYIKISHFSKLNKKLFFKKQSKVSNILDGTGGGDDLDAWMKSRMLLKPDDQLDLTDAELSEEIPKVLQSENSNVIKNLVIYNFSDGEYVLVRTFFFLCKKVISMRLNI